MIIDRVQKERDEFWRLFDELTDGECDLVIRQMEILKKMFLARAEEFRLRLTGNLDSELL